jgi:hypothetical protein
LPKGHAGEHRCGVRHWLVTEYATLDGVDPAPRARRTAFPAQLTSASCDSIPVPSETGARREEGLSEEELAEKFTFLEGEALLDAAARIALAVQASGREAVHYDLQNVLYTRRAAYRCA